MMTRSTILRVLRYVCLLSGLSLAFVIPSLAGEPDRLRDAVEFTPRQGLPNFFAKLAAGGDVRVAYLGGSITAQPGWRPKTLTWFQQQYPKAKVSEINAAIGGTGSMLGVFRLQHDVLQHKPDLLFVEFAVNDSGTPPPSILQTMEGIVRQTWLANPRTDICFVYTLTQQMLGDLQGGKFPRAASTMEQVADHYGIPSIHMGVEVAQTREIRPSHFHRSPAKRDCAERRGVPDDHFLRRWRSSVPRFRPSGLLRDDRAFPGEDQECRNSGRSLRLRTARVGAVAECHHRAGRQGPVERRLAETRLATPVRWPAASVIDCRPCGKPVSRVNH